LTSAHRIVIGLDATPKKELYRSDALFGERFAIVQHGDASSISSRSFRHDVCLGQQLSRGATEMQSILASTFVLSRRQSDGTVSDAERERREVLAAQLA
jgi:hypothetical protein